MLILCLLPPCSLATLPQVLWRRSFGLDLIPPSTSWAEDWGAATQPRDPKGAHAPLQRVLDDHQA